MLAQNHSKRHHNNKYRTDSAGEGVIGARHRPPQNAKLTFGCPV
jgi:hypothetical protein